MESQQPSAAPNTDLNCGLKDSLMPASLSLHSVDLLPVEDSSKAEPNVCCVTLRNTSNGHLFDSSQNGRNQTRSEVKVIHGNTEVYQCIRHVLLGNKDQSLVDNGCGNCEGIWSLPFRIPLKETKTTIQVSYFKKYQNCLLNQKVAKRYMYTLECSFVRSLMKTFE